MMPKPLYKRLSYFLPALLILPLFISCSNAKKNAVGKEDDIIVIADSSDYDYLEGSLLTVFSKIIYTPQPEKLFNLERKNLSDLEKYKHYKNIILIAPASSDTSVGKYINDFLDPQVRDLVAKDSVSVINKYNLWSDNQLVMVITAPNIDKLNKDILDQSDNLLHYFQKISNQRLSESLYNPKYEKKEDEAKLLKQYGWVIYVQADYWLAMDKPEDNFVWLRRAPGSDMERWIFVSWIDNASPAYLNSDSVFAIRNRLTKKFYTTPDDTTHVEILNEYKSTKEVNFSGKYALMTQGLWRMNDKSMGGPFVNYMFYDEPTKRIYMLDGSIYAPKYYKKNLIQQVDVLLQSFKTDKELAPDKRKELLDLVK